MNKETSWGSVAGEYADGFTNPGSYHDAVLLPNILRVLGDIDGKKILEVGCGDGFFTSSISKEGADVIGSDIAQEMIDRAKQKHPGLEFRCAPAGNVSFANDKQFDAVLMVLSLQNIEDVYGAFKEASRVIKNRGELVIVLNHPVLRIPQKTSWGWDAETATQYRRLDTYMSESRVEIDMDPGKKTDKRYTYSYHRPLQVYVKALVKSGFKIVGMEEWISHKTSEKGPKKDAEDLARKEFPLFLMVKAVL